MNGQKHFLVAGLVALTSCNELTSRHDREDMDVIHSFEEYADLKKCWQVGQTVSPRNTISGLLAFYGSGPRRVAVLYSPRCLFDPQTVSAGYDPYDRVYVTKIGLAGSMAPKSGNNRLNLGIAKQLDTPDLNASYLGQEFPEEMYAVRGSAYTWRTELRSESIAVRVALSYAQSIPREMFGAVRMFPAVRGKVFDSYADYPQFYDNRGYRVRPLAE